MSDFDKKYVNSSLRISSTSDGESGVVNLDQFYYQDILRGQQRIQISINKDDNDGNYSRILFKSPVDTCKLFIGTSFFTRALMENVKKSVNRNFTCPYGKNVWYSVTNLTITDKFIPPMPVEKKFKLESKTFGMIKEKKGWAYLFDFVLYGRYKK